MIACDHTLTLHVRSAETEPYRKYFDSLADPPFCAESAAVKIIAGEEQEIFYADKTILCKESSFFDRALNGRFLESNNEIRLPDESPVTVNILINWLYGRKILRQYGMDIAPASLSADDIMEFFRAFNAADKMCILSLKRHAGHVIFQWIVNNGGLCQ